MPGEAHDMWVLGNFMTNLFKRSTKNPKLAPSFASQKTPRKLFSATASPGTTGPVMLSKLPPLLRKLVERMMHDDPKQRPRSNQIAMNRILFRESILELTLQG